VKLIIKQYPCFVNKKYSRRLSGRAENNDKYEFFANKERISVSSRTVMVACPYANQKRLAPQRHRDTEETVKQNLFSWF
jgi:hypothetical protein